MRIFIALLFLATTTLHAQVGIGTPTPDTKAALDVSSNSKGLLIPRMSTAQRNAITSPPEGLIIFNTTIGSVEVYNLGAGAESIISAAGIVITIGSSYGTISANTWGNERRGMGQSFTSGGGLLSAISINIISIESSSSSPLYEMSIFSGTPSPTCGYAGLSTTTCAYADFGIPIATALVAVKSTGQNKLFFHSPVYLTAGEVYTFTLNPTTNTQSFRWSGQDGLYAGGQSFGINGSVSISGYDYSFQTHYLSSGWRAL